MFGKKTPEPTPTPTTEHEKRRFTDNLPNIMTTISSGVTLHGDLKGSENVELNGKIDGNVILEATLLVNKGGKVVGDVTAQNLIVDGEIQGDIVVKQKIELRDACRVTGNIQAGGIAIAEGAFFQGTVKMLGTSGAKAVAAPTFTEKRAEA